MCIRTRTLWTSLYIMEQDRTLCWVVKKDSAPVFHLVCWLLLGCWSVWCLFQEHTGRVFRLQFDEFQIVSSSHDDTILIWDFLNVASAASDSSAEDSPTRTYTYVTHWTTLLVFYAPSYTNDSVFSLPSVSPVTSPFHVCSACSGEYRVQQKHCVSDVYTR